MRRSIARAVSCTAAIGSLSTIAACGEPDDTSDGRELAVELTAVEFAFRADEAIEIRAGDTVTFGVRNEGELDHQLEVLSEASRSLGMTERIAPGARRAVTVIFDEPGAYRVVCDIDDHLSRGHQAVFEVAPAVSDE
ncbi:MAG: cupredoxin domain-containing protein [Actinomycetota bacterium]